MHSLQKWNLQNHHTEGAHWCLKSQTDHTAKSLDKLKKGTELCKVDLLKATRSAVVPNNSIDDNHPGLLKRNQNRA